MSALDDLASMHHPDPIAAAEQLAALLDLPSVGLTIRGARIVGKGSRASADLYLSNGETIMFESLREIAMPGRLALEIAAYTGATPKLKGPQAVQAVSLLRALAEHQESSSIDDHSIEWGVNYLQSAATHEVDMNDQAARWDAFCTLQRLDPASNGHTDSVAKASIVLIDTDGSRLVRCGWFRLHVKGEDNSVSPQEIAHRMKRVGWRRRGSHGRIKATRPGFSGVLGWDFYIVDAGWEGQWGDEG